jgi:hypothetical protein
MQNIIDIINSIDSEFSNINPTLIYNEGWMTRLLVRQSLKEKIKLKSLNFGDISNWTSEALISSPFIKAKTYREGYTHADIALGDFNVNYENRGEIIISDNAKIFGIIEAKMGSDLSKKTANTINYNQASRNLACIASKTYNKKDCSIFFSVVAPEVKLKEYKIDIQIDLKTMIQEIKYRFNPYENDFKSSQNMDSLIYKAETCDVWAMSYEEWIDCLANSEEKEYLIDFYEKAKKWNRIK